MRSGLVREIVLKGILKPSKSTCQDRIVAGHNVPSGGMHNQVWGDAASHELFAVGKAVVLCADASRAATGQLKDERLAGTAGGCFADERAAVGLSKSDNHVFSGRERAWAREHDNRSREVPRRIGFDHV